VNIPQYNLDGLGGEFRQTETLERSLAEFLGVKHCVMVTSGTAALFLALRATGAKKVAIPALTMFGSATAAELAGCEITFVSNNEIPDGIDTYLHVSLNGRDCGITEVLARYPTITVVEDACQALGSKYNGKYLGTFGKVGCFSFSPHKILTAGNGGCVVTNDDAIAKSVRKLKNFGREGGGGDYHDSIGYNFKFTDIQAEFMLKQFPELSSRIEQKKKLYARYYAALSSIMREHIGTPWFVDIYVDERDAFAAYLAEKGIGTRKMYPLLNTQLPFSSYAIYGDSAQDQNFAERGLWLPSAFNLTDKEVDYIITAIQERI
jgi:perosamine synthetase